MRAPRAPGAIKWEQEGDPEGKYNDTTKYMGVGYNASQPFSAENVRGSVNRSAAGNFSTERCSDAKSDFGSFLFVAENFLQLHWAPRMQVVAAPMRGVAARLQHGKSVTSPVVALR